MHPQPMEWALEHLSGFLSGLKIEPTCRSETTPITRGLVAFFIWSFRCWLIACCCNGVSDIVALVVRK